MDRPRYATRPFCPARPWRARGVWDGECGVWAALIRSALDGPGSPPTVRLAATREIARARIRGSTPIPIFVEALVLTIGALFPIMNPFSTAPLYVSLTAGFDAKKRKQQAVRACIYAFAILATFLLLGSAIVEFFGISIPGIRAAGGLIILSVGFGMLFPKPSTAEAVASESQAQELDVAFTPLAMPSLAGPGSISVVLSAAATIRGNYPEHWGIVYGGVILGMAVTLVIAFVILRAAELMVRFLGQGGMDAMTRIFGFLLICIGMQFLLTGVGDFFGWIPPKG